MDIKAIITRIDARISELGTTPRAVSIEAGMSGDGIRNWKRRASEGKDGGANMGSLAKVADALGVPLQWLLDGDRPTSGANGFSEDATPFTSTSPAEAQIISSLYANSSKHPAPTHRATRAMPYFGILPGDLIICDLSSEPTAGDLAIVTMHDDDTGLSTTLVRKFLPPYLIAGDQILDAQPEHADEPSIALRYPIIGVIRGTS